ncbi:hypothetical protein [uncultured Brachyspira sp.]|uniref:hypothetical protein n=1 Tax=uncultured Brachyspira sp. TaxID=221953 RepID=UPI00260FED3E|nr:hypothetical protein [uncultured Brachyspira sp.]
MGIVLSIVITVVLAFLSRKIIEENYGIPGYLGLLPIIFAIIYIVTPLDFVEGVFDDVLFLLIAIIHLLECFFYGQTDEDEDKDLYNFLDISKFILLGIGLILAVINAGDLMKLLFTLLLILLLAFEIVCLLLLFVGEGFRAAFIVAKPIVKATAKLTIDILDTIFNTIDSIINFIVDKYPNAEYLSINRKKKIPFNQLSSKIRENLDSSQYNKVCVLNLGVSNNNYNNLGNEEIYVDEELYNSVKTGEKYSLYN